MRRPLTTRLRTALLAVAVGIVLADSSVVTIALPEILSRYDVEVPTVAWTLTSFNLALAVAALPAALAARRRPGPVFALGIAVFALASLACALAPSFAVLVAGRAVQGVAGAAVVSAALDLLGEARIWALAGIAGAALGPAVGGFLTQLVGWEAIFVVQVPLVLLALPAAAGARPGQVLARADRPDFGTLLALLLVSAALVAPLFLLVVLLINGWRLEPLAAGAAVTVLPLAAVVAVRTARAAAPTWVQAASGCVLVAGGLAALGWLPGAGVSWTIAPQLAAGAGLGLAVAALTERALAGRSLAIHAGWTIAARHAGVVLGLLLLTPVFTHDLERSERDALAAGTSAVLDSGIPPLEKLAVARDVLRAVDEAKAEARIPAVEDVVGRQDDPAYVELVSTLQDQLDRAVTSAFSRAFLVAAALGLAALVPILVGRREAPG